MPTLSETAVVILHHGKPAVTRVALEQLRRAYPDPRRPVVILVENGPPPVAAGELGITVVRLPTNGGYGAGNNAGIRAALQAGVSFVILVNNDVILGPGSLEGLVAAASSREVGLVSATIREDSGLVYGGGRVNWLTLRTELAREPKSPEVLHYLHGACLGLTRRCLDTIGLLREDFFLYWEDVEYGQRARRAGFRFAVAAHPEVLHVGSAASRDATARKTYYLVRNALHCARLAAPRSAYYCAELLLPLREQLAVRRGKWIVARALADARQGVVGPAPDDLR